MITSTPIEHTLHNSPVVSSDLENQEVNARVAPLSPAGGSANDRFDGSTGGPLSSLSLSPPPSPLIPGSVPARAHTSPVLTAPTVPLCTTTLPGRRTKAAIKIASINLNGRASLASSPLQKWNKLNFTLKDKEIGVLAIQETHMTEDLAESITSMYGKRLELRWPSDHVSPNAAGIAFVLNRNLTDTKAARLTSVIPGRAAILETQWHNGEHLCLLNVYAPNDTTDNANFWRSLDEAWISRSLPRPDLMLGDFNLVEDVLDRLPAQPPPSTANASFAKFYEQMGLTDGWRTGHPDMVDFTHPVIPTARGRRSRLDRIYTTPTLLPRCFDWDITTSLIPTDHRLVSVKLVANNSPYVGKGRWTMHPSMLQHKQLNRDVQKLGKALIHDITNLTARSSDLNPQTLYATFKSTVMANLRQLSKQQGSSRDRELHNLHDAASARSTGPQGPTEEEALTAALIQEHIIALEAHRYDSIQASTQAHVQAKGESNTKFWTSLNKVKKPRDLVYMLKDPQLEEAADPYVRRSSKMAEVARDYHNRTQDTDNYPLDVRVAATNEVLSNIDTAFSKRSRKILASEYTPQEVHDALNSASPGRASGLDGLPYEFWKHFDHSYASQVTEDKPPPFNPCLALAAVFNDVAEFGITPDSSFAEGWMCPIYKDKGDRADIASYRPITLLNTDYKIMTKAIALRLAKTAPAVIHPNQAGFVPGRSITDQIRLTELMIDYAEVTEENGTIVALDQEKAYDKIAHDYLWKVLERFKLPKRLIHTIQALYANAHTKVAINGELSTPFKVTRGVRQGDPMSCLLFDLAIEPLAATLRASSLQGFDIPSSTERLITTLFADDTTVYLAQSDDFADLTTILSLWCTAARARFNVNKTKIIPIGSPAFRADFIENRGLSLTHAAIPDDPGSPQIVPDGMPTRILGAQLGNRLVPQDKWTKIIEKVKDTLSVWAKGHPSLTGKRLIVQMFVGGMTQFLTSAQGMPTDVEKTFFDLTRDFIWNGSQPRVAMETLSLPRAQGGLGLMDIRLRNQAIYITWVKSYLALGSARPLWAYVADVLLAHHATSSSRVIYPEAVCNPFLQRWSVATSSKSSLSPSLKTLVKTAKTHRISVGALKLSHSLRKKMPAWYHMGTGSRLNRTNNLPAAKCLRKGHGLRTIADALRVTRRSRHPELSPGHITTNNCRCVPCTTDRQGGCTTPHSCQCVALSLISALDPFWSAFHPVQSDGLSLTRHRKQANRVAQTSGDAILFDPTVTEHYSLSTVFRAFTTPSRNVPALRHPSVFCADPPLIIDIAVAAGPLPYSFGVGMWASDATTPPLSFRCPEACESTLEALVYGAIATLSSTPPFRPITLHIPSTALIDAVTDGLQGFEDFAWTTHSLGRVLKPMVALLRERSAPSYLSPAPFPLPSQASLFATLGCSAPPRDVPLGIAPAFDITGMRLSVLSQAFAYRAILHARARPFRRRAFILIEQTSSTLAHLLGHPISTEKVWLLIYAKAIRRPVQTFLWRALQAALACGSYWTNIPGWESLEDCPHCHVPESLDHILLDCDIPGRKLIWSLARQLLLLKGIPLPPLSLGALLGCGLLHHLSDSKGGGRLIHIVISESIYLIWKLRCERRIGFDDDPRQWHRTPVITSLWSTAINKRLLLDIQLTRSKFKPASLPRRLVLATWSDTLQDEYLLPEDWLTYSPRVLVGSRQLHQVPNDHG